MGTQVMTARPLADDDLRARSRRRTEGLLARPEFWYAVAAANIGVIIFAWWTSSGFEAVRGGSDFFNGLGRITGLLGTFLVLIQLLLMARVTVLEDAFGMERLAALHRTNGWISMELIGAHAVFQTVGYMLGDGLNVVAQLGTFFTQYEGLLAATAGFMMMIAVVATSISIARLHLSYETWYFVHLYTYLAIALAFSHQLQTGADFAGNPAFTAYWIGLYVVVIGALLFWRVVRPLLAFERHRFHVHSIVSEAPGVTSVNLRGRDLVDFHVEPGQFLIWRFLDRHRWWQAHPFSLSGRPGGRGLRMTARQVGDFTTRLHELKPGTPVLLEGPFGRFTPDLARRRKTLLVAGGVGITPIRALAEAMAGEEYDVCLIYRARREKDLIFKTELDELAASSDVTIHYLLTDPGTGSPGRRQWLLPDSLLRIVPDILEREVYICGPSELTRDLARTLHGIGLDPAQVHSESFRY